jgi:hypothetical protein
MRKRRLRASKSDSPPFSTTPGWPADEGGGDRKALKLKDGFVYVPLVVWYRNGAEKARYTLNDFPRLERELKSAQ